jgi:glycosyltransferase involved in cell wall biosynthesis
VNPLDPADIASKDVQAVEDPALRAALVQRGLARAREFTWQRTAEATLAVYDEIL